MPNPYGRIQFLKDAAWFGLSEEDAFSRSELRRQRDRLMHTHHPDCGGSDQMASRINITYTAMIAWLDRRETQPLPVRKTVALQIWAAASVVAALWISYLRRPR